MQASVRRIDLSQRPVIVEAWPPIDRGTGSTTFPRPLDRSIAGPGGRSGLWDAMASAVQRARETSTGGGPDAEVIDLCHDAPHLAYLARVACTPTDPGGAGPVAQVIAMGILRARPTD